MYKWAAICFLWRHSKAETGGDSVAGLRGKIVLWMVKRIATKAMNRFRDADLWYYVTPVDGEYHGVITVKDPGSSKEKDIVQFLLSGFRRSGAYDVSTWGKLTMTRVGGSYK